jgi:hypothetical protein
MQGSLIVCVRQVERMPVSKRTAESCALATMILVAGDGVK